MTTIITQIMYDERTSDARLTGMYELRFMSSKFNYLIRIIEGAYVEPFLFVEVQDKETRRVRNDLIGQEHLTYKNMIDLFRSLKNETRY